jgi:hypothetical protein
MRETRNRYNLNLRPQKSGPLRRPRLRWVDNNKIDKCGVKVWTEFNCIQSFAFINNAIFLQT